MLWKYFKNVVDIVSLKFFLFLFARCPIFKHNLNFYDFFSIIFYLCKQNTNTLSFSSHIQTHASQPPKKTGKLSLLSIHSLITLLSLITLFSSFKISRILILELERVLVLGHKFWDLEKVIVPFPFVSWLCTRKNNTN